MLKIAKCKNCGIFYPVKENEKDKKCPACRSEAGELMDYHEYKKGLIERIITIAGVTGMIITVIGFCMSGFSVHWTVVLYTIGGTIAGAVYGLNLERMSLSDIAAAVREEQENESQKILQ